MTGLAVIKTRAFVITAALVVVGGLVGLTYAALSSSNEAARPPRGGLSGPLGEKMSLEEAKRRAGYTMLVPASIPGNPNFRGVWAIGSSPDFRAGLFYEDRTFVEFLPVAGRLVDYSSLPGREFVRVRGHEALVRRPNPRASFPGATIRWVEGNLEIVVGGIRPIGELVAIAESLRPA